MCLYIGYKKPFVAKSDITVYKYVNKNNGKYSTACVCYPVNTNEVMKGDKNSDVVLNSHNKYRIEGGLYMPAQQRLIMGLTAKYVLKLLLKKVRSFIFRMTLNR